MNILERVDWWRISGVGGNTICVDGNKDGEMCGREEGWENEHIGIEMGKFTIGNGHEGCEMGDVDWEGPCGELYMLSGWRAFHVRKPGSLPSSLPWEAPVVGA